MTLSIEMDYKLLPGTIDFINSGPKKLFINNEWVDSINGDTFAAVNPASSEELCQVSLASSADVDRAVEAARVAFEQGPWSKISGEERGFYLWKIADLIEQYTDELAEIETLDNGKPIRISKRGDLPSAVKHFRYFAGLAGKIEGSTIPVSIPNQLVYTQREALGVVGLIIPWNFPLLMAAWKLAPALACGNTTLLKPAEETPLTAIRLGEIILEAGLPAGVVNILTGPGVPTGAAITEHMGVDKISFTGSTEVGRKIMEAAAKSNLKRVSLELGGKSPAVIFADADMDQAIKGATWAIFSTAGQECVAGSRLFIERAVYDETLEALKEQAERIRLGNGFKPNVHIGPIVSQQQLDKVAHYVSSGVEAGAEIITGGNRLAGELENGYFFAPTIFSHENDALQIVQEEIFGPVVTATPFDDWDELIQRANNSRYGLAAGVWTKDIRKAHRFASAIRAGTIWINGYGWFDAAAPFGGYKESGFGREMGKEAIDLFTQVKTVWVGL
jgi:acyl-CoA reductase-like NAD-dependent aldehyde dehydrogenase